MNLEYLLYGAAFVEGTWYLSKIILTTAPDYNFPPDEDKRANKVVNTVLMLPGPIDLIYAGFERYRAKRNIK